MSRMHVDCVVNDEWLRKIIVIFCVMS